MTIDLSRLPECVNKSFYPLLWDDNRYLLIYGGRGSGKSYFAVQKILYRILTERNHRFLIVRKYAVNIRKSVYQLMLDMIQAWGLTRFAVVNKTEMRIDLPAFNSSILFSGCDDPEKLKSIPGLTGIWIEELSELSPEDFNGLDLLLRDKTESYLQILCTYNPVLSASWVKSRFHDSIDMDNITIHKSTYQDNQHLPTAYTQAIETYKQVDPALYDIIALGQWASHKGIIFEAGKNYIIERLSIRPEQCDRVYVGLDHGYIDPMALLLVGIKDNQIYIFKELYKSLLTPDKVVQEVKQFAGNYRVIADSARPELNQDIRNHGVQIEPTKKGKGSVYSGIMWLKSRMIHIDPACTSLIRELQNYSWRETRQGQLTEEPLAVAGDHALDALRYATEPLQINKTLRPYGGHIPNI